MHPNPRRILPVVIIISLIALGVWYFMAGPAAAQTGAVNASGTIEATQIRVGPELGGRVTAINVAEGDGVEAGAVLIELDSTLLTAQRAQAEAALQAAEAAAQAAAQAQEAAQANLALLKAGPSAEQLAVAQTVIDRAQIAADALQESYADLSEAARDTTAGKNLKQQLDTALANLANAQAQYDLTKAGARPEQIEAATAQAQAAEAQAQAAAAQAEAARAALGVLDAQISKLTLTAPSAGVVLVRAIQLGEFATPGATLLTLADLSQLTLTVYVSEERYGQIKLGQTANITVDSFSGQTFTGTVTHIANQAEFTPRNVQTEAGRRTTVYGIELTLNNPDGKLKPGMPADVDFGD
jgi:multidrug efflux pump subunit AcrA (membrane-fusion protein)